MWFKNQPIKRKLAAVSLAATLFALLLAYAGFSVYERASFRASTVAQLTTLADTLGANAAASLTFSNKKTAQEILTALRAEPHVLAAGLYDEKGSNFAEYRRSGLPKTFSVPPWQQPGTRFDSQSVILSRKVSLNGEDVGTIVILSDLGEFRAKLRQYAQISMLVLLVSIVITYAASSRLLAIVTDPIVHLASIASRVSSEQDYSLRAVAQSSDEAGRLVHSFNSCWMEFSNGIWLCNKPTMSWKRASRLGPPSCKKKCWSANRPNRRCAGPETRLKSPAVPRASSWQI